MLKRKSKPFLILCKGMDIGVSGHHQLCYKALLYQINVLREKIEHIYMRPSLSLQGDVVQTLAHA